MPSPNHLREVLTDPSRIRQLIHSLDQSGDSVSLEKSWHGLHFVLTGTTWGGDPPLNFIATGGEPVGSEDVGYGPARILLPEQVAELDSALANFSDHEFARRFDLEALSNEAIYPEIWDEPREDLLDEYQDYLAAAKALIAEANRHGQAIIIMIR